MQELSVEYASIKSSFVNLPLRWANTMWDTMSETALCITYKQKIIYFGWSGACTKTYAKESLELDYSYKQILNIQPGTMVNVKPIKVSLGKMVSVEPLTIDDWEILELNASLLEDQFLNQIRVVYVDQVITIWINKAQIKLVVVKIDDGKKNVVCLNNESEIIVAPKQRKKVLKEEKVVMVSKAYPMEWTDLNIKDQLVLGNSLLDGTLVYVQNMDFNHLLLPITDNSIEAPNKLIKGIFLRVAVDSSVRNSVLDSATMQKINAVPMSRIKITKVDESLQNLGKQVQIETLQLQISSTNIVKGFKANIESLIDNEFIVYDRMLINFYVDGEEIMTLVRIKGKDNDVFGIAEFKIVNAKNIDQIDFVHVINNSLIKEKNGLNLSRFPTINHGFEEELLKVYEYFDTTVKLKDVFINSPRSNGVLVEGNIGSGKSTFLKSIVQHYVRLGYFPIILDCNSIGANGISKIQQYLKRAVMESKWQKPSLLVFDDLDLLIMNEEENDHSSRGKQLSYYLLELMDSLHDTLFVCSISDKFKLHQLLLPLFGLNTKLNAPSLKQRIKILENLLKIDHNVNLEDVSVKMDGYSLSDLNYFYESCLKNVTLRHIKTSEPRILLPVDVDNTFDTFRPLNLSTSKIEQSKVEWSKIGGMKDTKSVLLETLKWPTMYPQIFKKSPLRLRSGILLYGFPGCGKTMLANSVAKECGLNFISVKGPELLNKYIGQSEKSVRDIFQRARNTKPCLLFFDEFDSIAPMRGHDNSGVTDRVVNQFLTEMDGAEGLEGVYVLAATSRPEMIDSALLRPGRLDKSIFCNMPDEQGRKEIIKVIKTSILLSDDIDIDELANNTKGYTGADLQGLLYTAQLAAINARMEYTNIAKETTPIKDFTESVIVQGKMSKSKIHNDLQIFGGNVVEEKEIVKSVKIVVDQTQLETALKESRPSLRKEEYEKLERSYMSFRGEDGEKKEVGIKTLYA